MTELMTDSNGKRYVIVEKGDCLWSIADRHLGSGNKYPELAKTNNIKSPYYIYAGQKIYIDKPVSGSGDDSGSSKPPPDPNITAFGEISDQEGKLYATWTWSKYRDKQDDKLTTESYKVSWTYSNGGSVWFTDGGGVSTITVDEDAPELALQSTYDIPETATQVRFKVKPISRKKDEEDSKKETTYWEAEWSEVKTWTRSTLGEVDVPNVEVLEGFKLTPRLTIEDYDTWLDTDLKPTHIEFQIYKNDTALAYDNIVSAITPTGVASCEWTLAAGNTYKVRCRSKKGDLYSKWSGWSDEVVPPPAPPGEITKIEGHGDDGAGVKITWTKSRTAKGYQIEYASSRDLFDASSKTTTVDVEPNGTEGGVPKEPPTTWVIEDVRTSEEDPSEWFFRVRAKGENDTYSDWTDVKSITLGVKPDKPTTWSSVTTVVKGETVSFYWVHNSADGSKERYANLDLYVNGVRVGLELDEGDEIKVVIPTIQNTSGENDEDTIRRCVLDTSTGVLTMDKGVFMVDPSGNGEYSPTFTIPDVVFADGVRIEWQVQTCGAVDEYSDYSIKRKVDVYINPELSLSLFDSDNPNDSISEVRGFPVYLRAMPDYNTDYAHPIGYNVMIRADSAYETVDNVGNVKMVNAGDAVYSKHFDITYDLEIELSPSNIDLESGISYTVDCTVAMSTGLTANKTLPFTVNWTDRFYTPNAEISFYKDNMTTTVRPYCERRVERSLPVTNDGSKWTIGSPIGCDEIRPIYTVDTGDAVHVGDIDRYGVAYYCVEDFDPDTKKVLKEPRYWLVKLDGDSFKRTTTKLNRSRIKDFYITETVGDEVRSHLLNVGQFVNVTVEYVLNEHGEEIREETVEVLASPYYCTVVDRELVENVSLSVYRREFNGTFTELGTNLDNARGTTITDPHPSLDFARYRVVAKDTRTGAIGYYDLPGYPVNGKAVVIQWDEEWSTFDMTEDGVLEQPPWSGSMLTLPYNIDVDENVDPEVEMIEYIGRANPVSYYGTQRRQTATWNVVIPKTDKETIYGLRRLANWMGDVYVREPSGVGYWAHVVVSFSQTHLETTIPVTFTITRVEGGV